MIHRVKWHPHHSRIICRARSICALGAGHCTLPSSSFTDGVT